jgi:hypothetical protein
VHATLVERIAYTHPLGRYLVIASGCHWESTLGALSGTQKELLESVNSWRDKYETAKSIAIAGGGSVGLGELHILCRFLPWTYLVHRTCWRAKRRVPSE